MQNGFRIYNTDPLKQLERCDFSVRDGTGVGYIEMLFRTSFLGLLGGGHQARMPPNTACLWDGVEQKFVLELSYGSDVRAVRLRRDRIVVVLANAVKVYTFDASPELLYQTETCPNPLGLCHICQTPDNPLVVFPGRRLGSVMLVNAAGTCGGGSTPPTSSATSMPPPRQIVAHENPLVALTLNPEGSLMATASQRGTLVRIFSTRGLELLQELRRGTNPALITCICFDSTSSRIGVASTHGTVHVFENLSMPPVETTLSSSSVAATGAASAALRSRASAGRQISQPMIKSGRLLPRYFSSTSSQIRCTPETKFKTICAFSPRRSDTLIVLAADGSYYKYNYAPNGTVICEESINFLDVFEDENDL
ncbi:hypothetical protein AAHC03_020657 [Spirometra sp. Aus1]